MNFKRKWLFFVLPLVVLSAALGWVKWKADNPTPTTLDLEVRQMFLKSSDAKAVVEAKGRTIFSYQLSTTEKKKIAEHLFLLPSASIFVNMNNTSCSIQWDRANVGFEWEAQHDGATFDFNDPTKPWTYRLHPVTNRFLRAWFAHHSQFKARLASK